MEDGPPPVDSAGAATPPSPRPTSPSPIEESIASALRASQPSPASLGDRLLAQLVDGLVGVGLFFFVGMLLAPGLGGATAAGFQLEGIPAVLLMSAVLLLVLAYFVLFELAFGATLGKLVAGARVDMEAGGRLNLRAAVVRNVMRIVDGFGLYLVGGIAALVNRRRRRLGDLAAGTVVNRRDWPRPLRAVALFVALSAAVAGGVGGFMLRPPLPLEPRYTRVILTDDRNVAVHKELFSPTTSAFFIFFTVADVPSETTLKAVWTAEQVQGERPELKIDEAVVVAGGQRNQGDFSLARSSFSWPTGVYRADLFIGPRLAYAVRFRVEGPPGASGSGASPLPAGSPVPGGSSLGR